MDQFIFQRGFGNIKVGKKTKLVPHMLYQF